MCAPLIGPVSIERYLPEGQIEQVLCDGENYGGMRPCHYEWVKALCDECVAHDVTFVFYGTGRRFVKDGKLYRIEGSGIRSEQGAPFRFELPGKAHRVQAHGRMGVSRPVRRVISAVFRGTLPDLRYETGAQRMQ